MVPTWFPAWFRPIALIVRGSGTPTIDRPSRNKGTMHFETPAKQETTDQETTAETKWFQRGSRPGSGQSRCLYVVPAHQGNNRSRNNRGNKVGRFQRGSRPGSGQSRCLDVNVVFRRVIDRLSSTKGTTHHALQNTCETGNNRSRETTDHDR